VIDTANVNVKTTFKKTVIGDKVADLKQQTQPRVGRRQIELKFHSDIASIIYVSPLHGIVKIHFLKYFKLYIKFSMLIERKE